jgi:rhodanese-related sulfurtransferase
MGNDEILRVTVEEAKARLDGGEPLTFVDVRKESVFARGHIPGAVCLPVMDIEARIKGLPPASLLVFY